MNLTVPEIRDLYQAISDEYNTTPLAVEQGWFHKTTELGFMELRAIIKHLPESGVFIDIGTGKGIAPRFVKRLGARTISVDSLAAAGRSAVENVMLAGVEGYFCDVSCERIPVEDGTADCVLFADVIEHLLHSPKPVLHEIYRVLKPGGVCVATTPNSMRLTVRARVLVGQSNWHNIDDYFDQDFHPGHHHEYTIDEFKRVFQKTGFEIGELILYEDSLRTVEVENMSDIKTQDRSRVGGKSEPLVARLGKKALLALTEVFPKLRSNMLLIVRKPS